MKEQTRHLSVHISRPAAAVYEFAADPSRMPQWASGLGSGIEQVDGRWYIQTQGGRLAVDFAPRNEFGVLDHDVTMPSGEIVYNPMRVIADDAGAAKGCEVVFSLRRQAGMSDEEFDRDAGLVQADLQRLKALMEKGG
jgi:hypothetical protein